jgi:hypothetical protein
MCFRAGLAGAYADDLLEIEHENLAGAGGHFDGLDRLIEQLILDDRSNFDFGWKIKHVLCATTRSGAAILPAESPHFGHGDALHAHHRQGLSVPLSLNVFKMADIGFILISLG